MRLLLDTHILLWSQREPERLPEAVTHALRDPANDLYLSPITTWECLLLSRRGRVIFRPDADTWLRNELRRLSLYEAPVTHAVALLSETVPLPHRDPADRFLAATAVVHELTLVTADPRLLGEGMPYAFVDAR
ncbi:MAG: type II toxin-antitoxin system VapC family toxin [Deltaproteobacteria bacterium]|nr:type II toxin-antitoxin system VapC family toxin [Deltaproteobacteria bacterium]